jgi:glycosyltransferase involved in cell wall biosynthesis
MDDISPLTEQGHTNTAGARQEIARLRAAVEQLEERYGEAMLELTRANLSSRHLSDRLRVVEGSRSWAITAPLRAVSAVGYRLKDALGLSRLHTRLLRAAHAYYRRLPFSALLRHRLSTRLRKLLPGVTKVVLAPEPLGPQLEPPRPTGAADYLAVMPSVTEEVIFERLLEAVWGTEGQATGRITHIYLLPFLANGGAEQATFNYIEACNTIPGYRALIITTDRPSPMAGGIELPIAARHLAMAEATERLVPEERKRILFRIVNAVAPDVIHIVNSDLGWQILSERGVKLQKLSRIFASIFALQFEGPGRQLTGYAAIYLKDAWQFISTLLTDNESFAKSAKSLFATDESRDVRTLYNPPRIVAQTRVTPQHRVPLQLLWAGRLDTEKRLDLLLETASLAPQHQFHVFGSRVVDGGQRDPLHGAPPNVHFHGPFSAPLDLLAKGPYHGFVFTSRWEGMPNILLEVGMLGVPIVAPGVGGVPELIGPDTGYLVPPDPTPADYLEAIESLASDEDQASRRAGRLRQLIEERHSRDAFRTNLRTVSGYVRVD